MCEERKWTSGSRLCSPMLSPGTYFVLQRRCASSLRLRRMDRQRSCPHHLYHEQRVAFCLLIECVDHGWIKPGAHDMLCQGGRLGGRERPEGNLRHLESPCVVVSFKHVSVSSLFSLPTHRPHCRGRARAW